MPHLCNFIKKSDHQPCEAEVLHPDIVCGMHAPIKARLPPVPAGGCEHIIGIGAAEHWCARAVAAGDRLCARHVITRERQREELEHRNAAQAAARAERQAAWAVEMEVAHAVHRDILAQRVAAAVAGNDAAAHARLNPIARLAVDRQNVHTGMIVQQTNAGEEKLLAVRTDGRPVGLRVLRSFASRSGTLTGVLRVANDVEHWYNQGTCRIVGDRLYARCLEGLWTLIEQQPEEQRKELHKRLWEEANESVGMCCEGHLARLVNVMVGFDETFKPRVSTGEAIQSKIAEIAGAEISTEEKVAQARAFLTELAVPAAEQQPWLDALV